MGRWCYFSVATLVALILPTLNTATEFLTTPYYQHRHRGMIQDSYDDPDKNDPKITNDQLSVMRRYLARILVQPWPDNALPLVYIEDNESDLDDYPTSSLNAVQNNEPDNNSQRLDDMEDSLDNGQAKDEDALTMNNNKRNRYYRKYPWKRQNARQTFFINSYDADNRYLCQPSKDDVFRLLVALHDSKGGNRGRPIHFCNRKRPAHTIFTNIRFLGK